MKRNESRAEKIVEVLEEEFELDEITREILTTHLVRHLDEGGHLELIVDDPIVANWRLKDGRSAGTVRISDYSMSGNPARAEKEARINDLLAKI